MFSRKTIEATEVSKADILLNDAGYIDLVLSIMKPKPPSNINSIFYIALTYDTFSHKLMYTEITYSQTVVILSLSREKSNENQKSKYYY